MKRILCLMLALILCFMNGCSLVSSDNNGTTSADTPLSPEGSSAPSGDEELPDDKFLREYLENIDSQKPHVREVGDITSYIDMGDSLVICILYPETFFAPLDDAIELWISETAEYYEASVTEPLSDPAELTASYESRSIGNGLVSVRISGTFSSETLAHPDDFTKTFCYDIPDGEMKDISYLVAEDKLPSLTAMTAEKAGIPEGDAVEGILDSFFLTDEGIEIHLGRGKYLPASEGNVSVCFNYTDIADLLNEEFKRAVIPEDDPVFNEDTSPSTESTETEPTTTEPTTTEPTTTEPPITEPPVTQPPVTQPPETQPPVTQPPETQPPVTQPPVTQPPVTQPPVTQPPVTQPPVTQPPAGGDTTPKREIDPTKPMIALTFDDGPSAHTDRLLDIFAQYDAKGTFFVVGDLIDDRPSTVIRIVNEGHDIGNHSWGHKKLTTITEAEITDQIMLTRAKIYELTGYDTHLVRPPYGSCNDTVKAVGAMLGVVFINWSVDPMDWKSKNAEAVYNEIMNTAKDGAIVLCHDLHKSTVDAMELVIPKLIEEGYQLVTVSELMEYSGIEIEAGKIYYKA